VLSSLGSAVLKLSCGAAEAARLRSLVGPGQWATGVFIGMAKFGDTEWINRRPRLRHAAAESARP
jgi:hypothetical protein